jgi:hypothetical protein
MPLPGQTLGEVEIVTVDPAAGAEVTYTADADMIVHSLSLSLVTSAVAASRRVGLKADDGTNLFFQTETNYTQTLSQNIVYSAFEGAPQFSGLTINTIPLPTMGLRLKKGDRIFTATAAKDTGDNYGPMILQVERLGAA